MIRNAPHLKRTYINLFCKQTFVFEIMLKIFWRPEKEFSRLIQKSYKEISKWFNIPFSTVLSIVHKWKEIDTVPLLAFQGRFEHEEVVKIIKEDLSNLKLCIKHIQTDLKDVGTLDKLHEQKDHYWRKHIKRLAKHLLKSFWGHSNDYSDVVIF